jgi:deoxyribodipyrimidine photolyase-related protein
MAEATLILKDQLNQEFSIIKQAQKVVLLEDTDWADALPHHKKKMTLFFSAMRHFSDELILAGKEVIYYPLCEDIDQVFIDLSKKDKIQKLHVMEPSEYGVLEKIKTRAKKHDITLVIHPNEQFLYTGQDFDFKKPPLLETFYRFMRKQTGILMDGSKPLGGLWNFDKENRQKAPQTLEVPPTKHFAPDAITQQVMKEVEKRFPKNFGSTEGFCFPVTRKDALKALDDFIQHRLKLFGPYQDAMLKNQRTLFHSLLSPLLNLNILRPLEVVEAVEKAYKMHRASLASCEGFIRQILGWREYVHQVYKSNMPQYKLKNYFNYKEKLPSFYWDAHTNMECMKESIEAVVDDGINHHIQRLMITGNFALIAGINPQEVNDWYHFGYIDALDWVVTPNVLGLSLYADGGMIATKPYASSAGYIQKMSNYCKSCPYNPKTTTDKDSCPFNSLYWDFIDKNKNIFKKNPRMSLMLKIWNQKDETDKVSILKKAQNIKKCLHNKEIL